MHRTVGWIDPVLFVALIVFALSVVASRLVMYHRAGAYLRFLCRSRLEVTGQHC